MNSYDPINTKLEKNLYHFYPHDFFIICGLIIVLYISSLQNYLLFHSVSELLSVVVAICIFLIAWAANSQISNSALIIIGVTYLFVGSIDLLHMLTYKGMNIFPNDPNIPTQLWISSRYLQSISFFIAPFFIKKKIKMPYLLIFEFFITGVIISSIFLWGTFPDCFIEGKGLTSFKIISEYIISGILLLALVNFHIHSKYFDKGMVLLISVAIMVAIVQEILFTLYNTPFDFFNALGHFIKILSFYILFKVFFIAGIQDPARTIYKALSNSEERYRSLMELSPNAIMINRNGLIVKVNSKALEIFKAQKAEQILGKTPFELFHPDFHEQIKERIKLLRSGQAVPFVEERILCVDGSNCYASVGASPIIDSEGTAIQIILSDISEQKRTLLERQHTLEFFQLVNECTGCNDLITKVISFYKRYSQCEEVGIKFHTENERFNSEMENYLRFENLEIENMNLTDIGCVNSVVDKCLFHWVLNGKSKVLGPFSTEFGSFWTNSVESFTAWITNGNTKHCGFGKCELNGYESAAFIPLKIGHTIIGLIYMKGKDKNLFTEEKIKWWERLTDHTSIALAKFKADEGLKKYADELADINKELETFSYSVSHDLKAPLNIILGFSTILIDDFLNNLNDEGKSYLLGIKKSGEKMVELIDDMLVLSKVNRQELMQESVNISEMAQNIFSELKASDLLRNVEIKITNSMTITADPRLIKIALTNLINNAWKYSSKKDNALIEIGTSSQDGITHYYVKDNGAGFDMKLADKLFTPFKRLHSDSEFTGTGVGLAIVDRVIRRHGGKLWVQSEVGNGATFYFTIGNSRCS